MTGPVNSLSPRAYRIFTSEGSRYTARFDPQVEQDGILYGRMSVVGYCVSAEKLLRIIGMGPEPEAGGRLLIEDRPWSVEVVNGESVPLYEYENISFVQDITHVLELIKNEDEEKSEQAVEP